MEYIYEMEVTKGVIRQSQSGFYKSYEDAKFAEKKVWESFQLSPNDVTHPENVGIAEHRASMHGPHNVLNVRIIRHQLK